VDTTTKTESEVTKQPFTFGGGLAASSLPSLPPSFGTSFQSLTKDKENEEKDKPDPSISLKPPALAPSPVLDSNDRKDFAKEIDSPTTNQGKPPVIPSGSHVSIPFGIAFGSLKGDKQAPFSPSSSQRQDQQSQPVPAFTFGGSQPPSTTSVPPTFTFGGVSQPTADNNKPVSTSVSSSPSVVFGAAGSTQHPSTAAAVQPSSSSSFAFTAGAASQPSVMFGSNNNPTSAVQESKSTEQSSTGLTFSTMSNPFTSSLNNQGSTTTSAVPSFTASTATNNSFPSGDPNKLSFAFGGGSNTVPQVPTISAFASNQNSSTSTTSNPFSGNTAFPSFSNQPQHQQQSSSLQGVPSAFGSGNQPFTSSGASFPFSGGSTSSSHLSNEQKPSAFPAFGTGIGDGRGPFSSAPVNASSSNLSVFGTSGKESPGGGGFRSSVGQVTQQPQQSQSLAFGSGNQQGANSAPLFGNQSSSANPFGSSFASSSSSQAAFGQHSSSSYQPPSFAFGGNISNNSGTSGQSFQFGAGGGMGSNLTGDKPFQPQQASQFGGSDPFKAPATQPSSNNPLLFGSSTTKNTTGAFGGSMTNTGAFQQQPANSGFSAFGNGSANNNPFGSSASAKSNSMYGGAQQPPFQTLAGNNSNNFGGFGAGNASTNSLQSFTQFGAGGNNNNSLVNGPSLFAAGKADIPRTTSFRGGRQRGTRK
jgi:hypothetical protein